MNTKYVVSIHVWNASCSPCRCTCRNHALNSRYPRNSHGMYVTMKSESWFSRFIAGCRSSGSARRLRRLRFSFGADGVCSGAGGDREPSSRGVAPYDGAIVRVGKCRTRTLYYRK